MEPIHEDSGLVDQKYLSLSNLEHPFHQESQSLLEYISDPVFLITSQVNLPLKIVSGDTLFAEEGAFTVSKDVNGKPIGKIATKEDDPDVKVHELVHYFHASYNNTIVKEHLEATEELINKRVYEELIPYDGSEESKLERAGKTVAETANRLKERLGLEPLSLQQRSGQEAAIEHALGIFRNEFTFYVPLLSIGQMARLQRSLCNLKVVSPVDTQISLDQILAEYQSCNHAISEAMEKGFTDLDSLRNTNGERMELEKRFRGLLNEELFDLQDKSDQEITLIVQAFTDSGIELNSASFIFESLNNSIDNLSSEECLNTFRKLAKDGLTVNEATDIVSYEVRNDRFPKYEKEDLRELIQSGNPEVAQEIISRAEKWMKTISASNNLRSTREREFFSEEIKEIFKEMVDHTDRSCVAGGMVEEATFAFIDDLPKETDIRRKYLENSEYMQRYSEAMRQFIIEDMTRSGINFNPTEFVRNDLNTGETTINAFQMSLQRPEFAGLMSELRYIVEKQNVFHGGLTLQELESATARHLDDVFLQMGVGLGEKVDREQLEQARTKAFANSTEISTAEYRRAFHKHNSELLMEPIAHVLTAVVNRKELETIVFDSNPILRQFSYSDVLGDKLVTKWVGELYEFSQLCYKNPKSAMADFFTSATIGKQVEVVRRFLKSKKETN